MKIKIIVLILIFIAGMLFFYYYLSKSKKVADLDTIIEQPTENSYTSNIIENVEYISRDAKGNKYIIKAKEGEIDVNNNNIIFLKSVSARVVLKSSKIILINADYGKYNINNFDTIFSKNVLINYSNKKINSDYLDFSINRNSMIISKNVIYTDKKNILKTDVVEIDLETKNANFYMYDKNKKINIINKN